MSLIIKPLFDAYFASVYASANPPADQQREVRQAFYSGAHALLKVMQSPIIQDVPDDDGCELFLQIRAELETYAKQRIGSEMRQN